MASGSLDLVADIMNSPATIGNKANSYMSAALTSADRTDQWKPFTTPFNKDVMQFTENDIGSGPEAEPWQRGSSRPEGTLDMGWKKTHQPFWFGRSSKLFERDVEAQVRGGGGREGGLGLVDLARKIPADAITRMRNTRLALTMFCGHEGATAPAASYFIDRLSGDGQSTGDSSLRYFDTAHIWPNGTNGFANLTTSALQLTSTSIDLMTIDIASNWNGPNGEKMMVTGRKIWCGSDNINRAERLLRAPGDPTSANRAINPTDTNLPDKTIVQNTWLPTGMWGIFTDADRAVYAIRHYVYRAPKFKSFKDDGTYEIVTYTGDCCENFSFAVQPWYMYSGAGVQS